MIIHTLLELGDDNPVYDANGVPTGRVSRVCRIGFISDTSAEEALELTRTLMARLIEGREAWVRHEPSVESDRDVMRMRTTYTAAARFGYLVPEEPGSLRKVERAPTFVGFLGMPPRDASDPLPAPEAPARTPEA